MPAWTAAELAANKAQADQMRAQVGSLPAGFVKEQLEGTLRALESTIAEHERAAAPAEPAAARAAWALKIVGADGRVAGVATLAAGGAATLGELAAEVERLTGVAPAAQSLAVRGAAAAAPPAAAPGGPADRASLRVVDALPGACDRG